MRNEMKAHLYLISKIGGRLDLGAVLIFEPADQKLLHRYDSRVGKETFANLSMQLLQFLSNLQLGAAINCPPPALARGCITGTDAGGPEAVLALKNASLVSTTALTLHDFS